MIPGIFAKTFARPTVAEFFRAVAKHHLRSVQFNFASAGLPSLPDEIDPALAKRIRKAASEQRIAMSGWRESLDHLRKATTGLGLSMQRYHRTLGKLGTDVAELHSQAVRLEDWADDALKRQD